MKLAISQSTAKAWHSIKGFIQHQFLLKTGAGFSLVEALLSLSVFSLLVTALVGAYLYGEEATALAGHRNRAVLLAEEGLEAVRNIRDSGFSNLTSGTRGLAVSGNQWTFSGASDTSDIFTRQIEISSPDANRRYATSTVTWQQNLQRQGSVSLATEFANWLATSGIGNWSNPIQAGAYNAAGAEDGLKVQTAGNYAYFVRNGGTPDFLVMDISSSTAPTLAASLGLTGTPTNIALAGNYAYVSNQDDSQELQVIDISTPTAPSAVGSYNAAGTANANGVYASGSTVYLVRDSSASNEFLIINASTPATPTLTGSLDLGATGYEVVVIGNYAYVASASNSQELQVISLATPATPSQVGSLNLSGNTDSLTIAGAGSVVYFGQGNSFHAVSVATPASPSLLNSLGVTNTINDISLDANSVYAFLATGDTNSEFQIVDISAPSSLVSVGSVNLAGSNILRGIAYSDANDRAYGVSTADANEFIVFAPQ